MGGGRCVVDCEECEENGIACTAAMVRSLLRLKHSTCVQSSDSELSSARLSIGAKDEILAGFFDILEFPPSRHELEIDEDTIVFRELLAISRLCSRKESGIFT
jgi:hypothetical protein